MRLPGVLRSLDDRVLGAGRRGSGPAPAEEGEPARRPHHAGPDPDGAPARPPRRPAGDGVREVLGVVWRVSRWVLLALAAVVVVGIALTFAPTNDDNVIVRNALDLAAWATGPFEDVFTADDEDRALLYNYALAAVVYLVAAGLVTKLPGKRATRR